MLKGHLPRVMYHHVYWYTKIKGSYSAVWQVADSAAVILAKVQALRKLPWRDAGPPNHHDDKVDSDWQVADSTAVNLAKVQALRKYRWLDNYTQKVFALQPKPETRNCTRETQNRKT